MKKLKKFEDNFAALENKKLANLKTIAGGEQTSRCSTTTARDNGSSDVEYSKDGKVTGVMIIGPLE